MKIKAYCGYLTVLINGKPLAKPHTGPSFKEIKYKIATSEMAMSSQMSATSYG